MNVHRICDVLGSRPEFDRQNEFMDDFAPLFTDHVTTQ